MAEKDMSKYVFQNTWFNLTLPSRNLSRMSKHEVTFHWWKFRQLLCIHSNQKRKEEKGGKNHLFQSCHYSDNSCNFLRLGQIIASVLSFVLVVELIFVTIVQTFSQMLKNSSVQTPRIALEAMPHMEFLTSSRAVW